VVVLRREIKAEIYWRLDSLVGNGCTSGSWWLDRQAFEYSTSVVTVPADAPPRWRWCSRLPMDDQHAHTGQQRLSIGSRRLASDAGMAGIVDP
jgi:hypothetical protein